MMPQKTTFTSWVTASRTRLAHSLQAVKNPWLHTADLGFYKHQIYNPLDPWCTLSTWSATSSALSTISFRCDILEQNEWIYQSTYDHRPTKPETRFVSVSALPFILVNYLATEIKVILAIPEEIVLIEFILYAFTTYMAKWRYENIWYIFNKDDECALYAIFTEGVSSEINQLPRSQEVSCLQKSLDVGKLDKRSRVAPPIAAHA